MKAANAPRTTREVRVLEVGGGGEPRAHDARALPRLFRAGDVLVVNDAATLPASIAGTFEGAPVEARLVTRIVVPGDGAAFTVALFGAGDHRQRTEDRPPPPALAPGDVIVAGHGLRFEVGSVSAISPRLVDVTLHADGGDVWTALYRAGRPVQYAHVTTPLALWEVQNVYASRPWAIALKVSARADPIATAATAITMQITSRAPMLP